MDSIQSIPKIKISSKSFDNLPTSAGVYVWWAKNRPIYIGKSVNLKSRLKSYLLKDLGIKTKAMVNSSEFISYIEVTSELEALLLESTLIKKYKPKYNVVLKDDKNPLYIVITKEDFPRVLSARKLSSVASISSSYGPFPSSSHVKRILKAIRKIVPFSDHKISKKPCLYSHIGLCDPCPNSILTQNDQSQIINFKKEYRKNIRNIKLILSRKFSFVRNDMAIEMDHYSNKMDFEKAINLREKIKLFDYITQSRNNILGFVENPNLIDDLRTNEINNLISILKLGSINIESLKRIECFDIAHLSGSKPTASMVVNINGNMDNREYRHFKIKQAKSQSDYDSMNEVAKRRIKYLASWGVPDLIIVDGGLGQVKVFNKIFKEVEIPVVGIAKNPDRLIFEDGKKIVLKGDALNLVSRIRDEAHRFARRLHHKLLSKSLLS